MIARLTGKVVEAANTFIVLDVNGVGYLVSISKTTAQSIPTQDQAVCLQIYTHVREDSLQLFGFLDKPEKQAFEALISMTGMGPKAAMGVLSGIQAAELAQAITTEDLARLCAIPGVGKKKAERMVVELKDKLQDLYTAQAKGPEGEIVLDLRSALTNLGFRTGEIDQTLEQLRPQLTQALSLELLLPKALKILRG